MKDPNCGRNLNLKHGKTEARICDLENIIPPTKSMYVFVFLPNYVRLEVWGVVSLWESM